MWLHLHRMLHLKNILGSGTLYDYFKEAVFFHASCPKYDLLKQNFRGLPRYYLSSCANRDEFGFSHCCLSAR